jgi:hypothetical protein
VHPPGAFFKKIWNGPVGSLAILTRALPKFGRRLIYGVGECRSREGKLFTHSTIAYIRE